MAENSQDLPKARAQRPYRPYWAWLMGAALTIWVLMSLGEAIAFAFSMFGLAFLAPILLNIGLVWMAVDAWRRRIPRLLIWIPAAYFGGYLIALAVSWSSYLLRSAAIERENAAFAVPFRYDAEDLVEAQPEMDYGGPIGPELVARFRLPAAYGHELNIAGGMAKWQVAPGELCRTVPTLPGKLWKTAHRLPFGPGSPAAEQACVVAVRGAPTRPQVSIRAGLQEERRLGGRIWLESVTASRPGHPAQTLRTGYAEVLSPVPFPLYVCWAEGCQLDWSTSRQPIAGGSPLETGRTVERLGAAWGLPRRSAPPGFDEPAMQALAAQVATEAAAERAVVEQALADPEAKLPLYFWPLVEADPDWGRRIEPALRRAHAEALESGRRDRSEPIGIALQTLERQKRPPPSPAS